MTGTRDPQQDGSIQAMLSDSGLESAAELRSALEQLRAVVPDAAPTPRADLAALLAAGAAGVTGPAAPVSAATTALPAVASAKDAANQSLPTGVTSLAERRGRKRRLAVVGGAVVGAMTLGAGAVAASSEDFRHSVSQTVGVIFLPAGHGTPAPEHVQPSPSQVPALPAPAATFASRHGLHLRVQGRQTAQALRAPRRPDTRRPPSAATVSCRRPARGPNRPAFRAAAETEAARTSRAFRAASHQPCPASFRPRPPATHKPPLNPVALSLRAALSAENDPK